MTEENVLHILVPCLFSRTTESIWSNVIVAIANPTSPGLPLLLSLPSSLFSSLSSWASWPQNPGVHPAAFKHEILGISTHEWSSWVALGNASCGSSIQGIAPALCLWQVVDGSRAAARVSWCKQGCEGARQSHCYVVTKSVDRTNSGPTEGFKTSWRSGSHMFQRDFRTFQHFLIPTLVVAKTLVAHERLHPGDTPALGKRWAQPIETPQSQCHKSQLCTRASRVCRYKPNCS